MSAVFERYIDVIRPYLQTDEPNEDGEIRMRCPLHDDKHPSASVNIESGLFNCLVCGGSSLKDLTFAIHELGDNVKDLGAHKAKKGKVEALSLAKVAGWHEYLISHPELMKYLAWRGIDKDTVAKFKIGYDANPNEKGYPVNRYILPVFDNAGTLVNLRKYKADAEASQKMLNAAGHGSPPRLYPAENLKAESIVVCEGEWDALTTSQHGIPAVTGTHGAKTWHSSWTEHFKGKTVVVIYDKDKDGRYGAKRAADALRQMAASVTILELPLKATGSDLTDWFTQGHTAEELLALINEVMPEAPAGAAALEVAPYAITVSESMSANHAYKPLTMEGLIIGRRDPTHFVPQETRMVCDMKAGPKCKGCVMMDNEGESTLVIDPKEVDWLARFLEEPEDRRLELLRRKLGAVKCNRLTFDTTSNFTVEEMHISQSINRDKDDGGDPVKRRVYCVQNERIRTNAPAMFTGTVIPNPKDGRSEFFAWEVEETETNIDKFHMTPELRQELTVFQPKGDQTPLEKMREIATDLSVNVTRILGRERLHMAMDLVWHSALRFYLEGQIISRGWLELLVIGDTRTGKSETAMRLMSHYGLGQLINCEATSLAGLIGGVQQVRNSWTLTWGALPLNNRRLVVLDEFNGLKPEDISLLSDIRSRGIAQITKVVSHSTEARVRGIYISNPRTSSTHFGVDKLEELIGQPEDIARFDFAMSVRKDDVDGSIINSRKRPQAPHIYTSALAHELILWVWSRKPEQILFTPEAYDHIYVCARWLGRQYSETPPLVQRANVREKVARLAVAVAGRVFSTDSTGEALVVRKEHVAAATKFLDTLYSYPKFGYRQLSERTQRNEQIAKRSKKPVHAWLMTRKRLTEFLIGHRRQFKTADIEETTNMSREDVLAALNFLDEKKMIRKERGYFHLEDPLLEILAEIEKEQRHK
jgi:MCM2/3/5 family protein/Toprim domain-containing protein